jgi:hypothetical protein
MVRASPNLNSFDAGELSPTLEGRTDLSRYRAGCRLLENFLPSVVGPVVRRPGSRFIAATRYPDKTATLIAFQYSTEQAYALEFGDLYVRFYRNDGPLLEATKTITGATRANPVVLTIAGHGYANGDDIEIAGVSGMTQLNGRRFRVANKTANTLELTDLHGSAVDGSGFGSYAGGGTAARVYTLATPYLEADLPALKVAQSADVLYIAHVDYVPRKLQRYGATNWVLAAIDFLDGPYLPLNGSQATLTPSATSGAAITISSTTTKTATGMANNGAGAIRVTCANHGWKTGDRIDIAGTVGTTEANGSWSVIRVSAAAFDLAGSAFVNAWTSGGTITPHVFEPTDVGRLVRIQHASTWGYAKIVGYTSAVSVTADVMGAFGATTASANWRLGLYSAGGGYPSCVTFYEGRLFFGGCPLAPTRIDGSQSSNYESFPPSSSAGVVSDDNAVAYPLDSGDVNNVVWMKDDEKGLLVGTRGGEWLVRANSLGDALTPTNVKAVRGTTFGSYENAQPVRTGKDVIFIQRKQRKARNLNYTYETDGFQAGDLTLLSPHLTQGAGGSVGGGGEGLGQLAYQAEPSGWVWCVRGDGQVPVLAYDRDEQKIGWARVVFGGTADLARQQPAACESLCSIPDPADARDEIWAIVRRSINGRTERSVELIAAPWEPGDDQETAFYVDCGLVFDGRQGVALQPGIGADQRGSTGVSFTAATAAFAAGDVGRVISRRFFDRSLRDPSNPTSAGQWRTAKATITGFVSATVVTATITAPFPDLAVIPAGGWRLSATRLSNLWHLEGETLSINAEGASHPDVVVANGSVTLTRPAGYAVAGLACPARLQTMRIEAGAQDGTAQGKVKRINEVTVRLVQSLGGEAGPDFTTMAPLQYRTSATPLDQPPAIGDGDARVLWHGGYDGDARLAIRQAQPFPMTLVALMPQIVTYERG